MAELGKITVNDHRIISTNTSPLSVGIPAEEGSLAFMDDSGTGRLFLKEGPGDTEWRDIVGSGGSVSLVSTATASNSAQIEFTSGIDEVDTAYILYGSGITPVTNSVVLYLQISQDGGTTYKSTSGDYDNDLGSVTTAIDITKDGVGNTAGYSTSFATILYNPASTVDWKTFSTQVVTIKSSGSLSNVVANSGIYKADTNAYNAFKVFFSSGNISNGLFQLFKISTSTGGPSPTQLSGSVSTTDATVTDIITISTSTNTTKLVDVDVTARRTGGTAGAAGDSAGWRKSFVVKNVAGTVTINRAQDSYTFKDQIGWDTLEVVSGTNVKIQVKGAANNNVDWVAQATVDNV